MSARKVNPVLGPPSNGTSSQNASLASQNLGTSDSWCLPSGQPLVDFALSEGLVAQDLLRLAEAQSGSEKLPKPDGSSARECDGLASEAEEVVSSTLTPPNNDSRRRSKRLRENR